MTPFPPPAAKFAERLPGALRVLVETSVLPADTPGLLALVEHLPSDWSQLVTTAGRLEQRSWPLAHDVALACRACARIPAVTSDAQEALALADAWLEGRVTGAELQARSASRAMVGPHEGAIPPGVAEADVVPLLQFLARDEDTGAREAFLARRRRPPVERAASLVVHSACNACDGWLMYFAHRNLPTPSATFAAQAIHLVVLSGAVSWVDVVGDARSLVATPGTSPRALASRP